MPPCPSPARSLYSLHPHALLCRNQYRIRAALDIPDRYAIPMVVATGYPASPPPSEDESSAAARPRRWRYPPREVVFDGAFGVGMEGVDSVVD